MGGYYNGVWVPNLNPNLAQTPQGQPKPAYSLLSGAAGTPGGPPLQSQNLPYTGTGGQQTSGAPHPPTTPGAAGSSTGQLQLIGHGGQSSPYTPSGYNFAGDDPRAAWMGIADQAKSQGEQKLLDQKYYQGERHEDRSSQAFDLTRHLIEGLQNSMNTSNINMTGGSGSGAPAPIAPPSFTPDAAIDTAATNAQNAAFGQAKSRAGALGRSSIESLRAEMAQRGIVGGGTEGRGLTDRLAAATNPLSDLNTQALHENVGIAEHNQDLRQQSTNTGYQGAITQRGQDISALANQQQLRAQQQSQSLAGLVAALNNLSRLY